jgi:mono/diheme cytochrome c family protein
VRNERKYKIISLLSVLLAVLLLGNCLREPSRMQASVDRQHEEYVLAGATIYSQNCIQCHGPKGEGSVGMPLNRKAYQVDYESPAGKDIFNLLQQTIRQGRPGNDNHPQWEKAPDGKWISYTTMPSWGRDFGGPLDDDKVRALALFIMNQDAEQWNLVGDKDMGAPLPDTGLDKFEGKRDTIPLPESANKDVDASAKTLLRNGSKANCLSCHSIGSIGGKVGPDLTHVGSWGVDQAFLENWIKYPNANPTDKEHPEAIPHDVRMPVYWSANRATRQPTLNTKDQVKSEGPYSMPRFKGVLTDNEISVLAKYLMGLK